MTLPVIPEALRDLPGTALVDVDVREDLMNGREPFDRIMTARQSMPPDGVLRVRAIFDPVPLYSVMAGFGLKAWTEELGPQDWRVWFYDPKQVSRPRARCDGGRGSADEGVAAVGDLPGLTRSEEQMVLDVRVVEPREKHPTIFRLFASLSSGEVFTLVNDHDPKPLWYQFQAEEEGHFTWTYLEEGPEVWRVEIGRV